MQVIMFHKLATVIVQSKSFNVKGTAIGNPLLEFNTDVNAQAEYLWAHGVISDATYKSLNTICNFSQIFIQQVTWNGTLTPICSDVYNKTNTEISQYVNLYDVTLDVCLPPVSSQTKVLDGHRVDVCIDQETTAHLNRVEVQEALHARLVGITQWNECSVILNYTGEDITIPTISVLGELAKSGVRVLVYSGDQDSVIPLIGTRTLVTNLAKQMGLDTTGPYRVCFDEKQVAGWTQVYGDGLSYATIRGAGHEAPFTSPRRSLSLFRSFLEGKPLPGAV